MRVGLLSLFTLDGNGESEAPRDLGEIHICEMTRSPDAARKSQLGHVTCGRWVDKNSTIFLETWASTAHAKHRRQANPPRPRIWRTGARER